MIALDADRLRGRAVDLRAKAEHLADQAKASPPAEQQKLQLEARETVFVAFTLMVIAELVDEAA